MLADVALGRKFNFMTRPQTGEEFPERIALAIAPILFITS